MITGLPFYISIVFGLTTLATLFFVVMIVRSSDNNIIRKKASYSFPVLIIWLGIQAVLAIKNVYSSGTNTLPPKIVLFGVLPALAAIAVLFLAQRGRKFMDSLSLAQLTYLHMVRIPVEIVLFWLFLNHTVPQLMTFEGRNFDILAGITAPVVAYLGVVKGKMNRHALLLWNIFCLGLLLNIVINALLSAPSPLQKFAFDQPNIAIFYFPFVWLPSFIVPAVLASHLIAIRRLLQKPDGANARMDQHQQ